MTNATVGHIFVAPGRDFASRLGRCTWTASGVSFEVVSYIPSSLRLALEWPCRSIALNHGIAITLYIVALALLIEGSSHFHRNTTVRGGDENKAFHRLPIAEMGQAQSNLFSQTDRSKAFSKQVSGLFNGYVFRARRLARRTSARYSDFNQSGFAS